MLFFVAKFEERQWLGYSVATLLLIQFLGACANLRKATICFVMSVRPSIRLSAWKNS